MCGYFCIEFINFMLKDKSLTDFINRFSPNNFKRNDDIILNYFKIYVILLFKVYKKYRKYKYKSFKN